MARMEGKEELVLELGYMEMKRALALSKMVCIVLHLLGLWGRCDMYMSVLLPGSGSMPASLEKLRPLTAKLKSSSLFVIIRVEIL
jgi:hypothetical protein